LIAAAIEEDKKAGINTRPFYDFDGENRFEVVS
jgi:hypothetical protein